jgi:putative transposase
MRLPEIGVGRFVHWLGVTAHNGWVPRDFWLEPWEKGAILGFHLQNPLRGLSRPDVHDA